MSFWTAERHDKLVELFAEGWSGSQIGAVLGVSRNAVIGRLHRRGLKRGHVGRKATVVEPRPKREPKPPAPKWLSLPKIACEPVREPVRDSDRPLVALFDLTNTTCRWPIGDPGAAGFGFCGGPADLAEGRPYCLDCGRLAYR